MKWVHKKTMHGDKRSVVKFAWFPTRLSGTDIIVWFECYYADQRYMNAFYFSYWETEYRYAPGTKGLWRTPEEETERLKHYREPGHAFEQPKIDPHIW